MFVSTIEKKNTEVEKKNSQQENDDNTQYMLINDYKA